jgi:hypothetical protein
MSTPVTEQYIIDYLRWATPTRRKQDSRYFIESLNPNLTLDRIYNSQIQIDRAYLEMTGGFMCDTVK